MRIGFLLFFWFCLWAGTADAQSVEDLVKDALGGDYQQLKQNNPDSLYWLEYWVEHGQATMKDAPAYKLNGLKPLSELTYADGTKPFANSQHTQSFNRLKFPNPKDNRFAVLYRIDDTADVFVIRPVAEVKLEFEESYGK